MRKTLKYLLLVVVLFITLGINAFAIDENDIAFLPSSGFTKQTIYIPDDIKVHQEETPYTLEINNFTDITSVKYQWIDMLSVSNEETIKEIKQFQVTIRQYNEYMSRYSNLTADEQVAEASTYDEWRSKMSSAITSVTNKINNNNAAPIDDAWKDSTDKVFYVPKNSEYSDAMLVWVQVTGKIGGEDKTLYMFRLYVPEDPVPSTAKNPDTGIENPFVVIVPLAIVFGSAIILNKKRYA